MLNVRDMTKSFVADGRRRTVLRDISFQLGPEETLAVVGPSGCGKTTLLYLLCGLAAADAGEVSLDGRAVTGPSQQVAIILQDYGLLPWRTVRDNVALGLKMRGVERRRRRAEADKHLARLGLAGRERDYPGRLSGGEQQRVAIARAYAVQPRLLLMDEPFSSLDALTRERLQATLVETWRATRVPYILVTHSVDEAVFLGRRIMLLAGEPARPRAWFDNPGFGGAEWRESPEFFDLARRVRGAMEELWAGEEQA